MAHKRFTVGNMLAEAVSGVEAPSAAEAIRRSEENLADLADAADERLAVLVAELADVAAQREEAGTSQLEQVGALAARLVGLGALTGKPAIDSAAACLCEVGDRMLETGAIDLDAIGAHVWMIRRLASGQVTADEEAAMLDALQDVRRKLEAQRG